MVRSGYLRIVSDPGECRWRETPISWNQACLPEFQLQITVSDLVGTWNCAAYRTYSATTSCTEDWTISNDGLCLELTGVTITFIDDGDGTFSLVTSAPNPFSCKESDSLTSIYEVVANTFFTVAYDTSRAVYSLHRVSENTIIFHHKCGCGGSTVMTITCDKVAEWSIFNCQRAGYIPCRVCTP